MFLLKILTGKNHPQIKLQNLRKVWIWTFGWLVHQKNSFYKVLKLKQNFRIYKVVASKTAFFVTGLICTSHSIYLNIGIWQSSFIFVRSSKKWYSSFLKGFVFSRKLFQNVQNFQWVSQKNMPISQTECCFKNSWYHFLEQPMLFLLALKTNI